MNDFFCGAGGMGLGFQLGGFKIIGAWDIDKYAVQSYKENVGDHVKQSDISKMTAADITYADVWTFGFPCQDLSLAGKMAGMKLKCNDCKHEFAVETNFPFSDVCPKCTNSNVRSSTRSGLFFEIMRLLDETDLKPKVLLAENVKGLKPYLPVLEQEYQKRGYKMQSSLFNSKYWGVPQNRERYFVVGIREDLEQTFKFPEQKTDFIPKLSSVLETDVDEKYYIADDKAQKIIDQALQRLEQLGSVHATITPNRLDRRQKGRRSKENEEEMFTLTAQDLHGVIIDDTYGYDGVRIYDEVSPTIRSHRQGQKVIEQQPEINVVGRLEMKGMDVIKRVYDPEGLSPTLTTSQGGHRQPKILQGYRVRKLTPREYARLQSFPDTYKFVCSDSQMYKQFGNAVTVNVSEAIATSIKEYLLTVL